MFKDNSTFHSFSVDDIPKAKKFYGQTLGLDVSDEEEGLAISLAGGANLFIYPKGDEHEPATFTVLNFEVDDVDAAVGGLTDAGATMEHYDGVTDDNGVYRGEGPVIAWFKDPAGNVLSVIETS